MSITTEKDSIIQALNRSFSENSSTADDRIRVEFDERVQTFVIEQKWLARSVIVSPAVCAQYGWKCLRPNILMCVTCRATLSSGEVAIDKYETYKSCAEKLLQDIKGKHNTHCPWPWAPCPASFVKMVPMHRFEAQSEFEKRFKTLLSYEKHLPLIKDPLQKDSEENNSVLSLRFKVCNLDPIEAVTKHRSAFSLAVTGWSLTTGSKSGRCLTCIDCHRSASLLLYATNKSDTNESTQETSEAKENLDKNGRTNKEPINNDNEPTQQTSEAMENLDKNSENNEGALNNVIESTQETSEVKENSGKNGENNEVSPNNDNESTQETSESKENLGENGENNEGLNNDNESTQETSEAKENLGKNSETNKRPLNNTDEPTHETSDVNENLDKKEKNNEGPQKKKQRLFLKKEPFDPLYEHRPWCLWINQGCDSELSYFAQNSSLKENETKASAKGWEVFLSCCTTNASRSDGNVNQITSPSKEEVQVGRNMINVWTEVFV